jgi:hypothetical protein
MTMRPYPSVVPRMSQIAQEIDQILHDPKLSQEQKNERASSLYLKLTYLRECGSEFIN